MISHTFDLQLVVLSRLHWGFSKGGLLVQFKTLKVSRRIMGFIAIKIYSGFIIMVYFLVTGCVSPDLLRFAALTFREAGRPERQRLHLHLQPDPTML